MFNNNAINFTLLTKLIRNPDFISEFKQNPKQTLLNRNVVFKQGLDDKLNILAELGLEELNMIAQLNVAESDVYENIGTGVIF